MVFKKETIEHLSHELSLPYTGVEQDWDIEFADSNRVDEFISFYKERHLCEDEKVAVMSLVLSSYDDLLNENDLKVDNRWRDIQSILRSEKMVFIELIDYWSLSDEVKEDDLFCITHLVRSIK